MLFDMRIRAHAITPSEAVSLPDEGAFRADYVDAFGVEVANPRTAKEWARGSLEQEPAALRWFVMFGWRYVLRLRLRSRGEAGCVAGWPILLDTPEIVVLGVDSAVLGRARLTFRASDTAASVSSHIAFERRGARAVWAVVGLMHRRILPYILGYAAAQHSSRAIV